MDWEHCGGLCKRKPLLRHARRLWSSTALYGSIPSEYISHTVIPNDHLQELRTEGIREALNGNDQGNHTVASEHTRGISDVLIQSRGLHQWNWSIDWISQFHWWRCRIWAYTSEVSLSSLLASELVGTGLLCIHPLCVLMTHTSDIVLNLCDWMDSGAIQRTGTGLQVLWV